MFNDGENDSLLVAKRELMEGTGYRSGDWAYLGDTRESSFKLTNHMYLFLVSSCYCVIAQHLNLNEDMDVFEISLKEAVDVVMTGKINVNFTAHLILKVAKMLGE